MSYFLLTGATGLLGNYLVRDLMLADVPLAVVVRPSRKQSARQRVEQLLCEWEQHYQRSLPRPVVLEGDIAQPDLGLDGTSLRWVAEYCDSIIHNAASLQFHATSSEGEPWRSNVGGTKNVLEFCRVTKIRKFHHVSTAYVAGTRSGRVLETELDVGQIHANDYEKAKLQAETLVRQADFLEAPTVYRPGIIIGDSQTGFTTTYHGFYAALQLTHTMVRTLPINGTGRVGGFVVRLGLTGEETKHLVPVDWVSAFMAHVLQHPELHHQTYHLTPRHPVTTRLIRDVLEHTAGFFGAKLVPRDDGGDPPNEIESLFHEHIRVYNSYWRMDPEFDTTNTEQAAPHLPCPHVDRDMLVRLSRIAIDSGFPTPGKKPIEPEFDAQLSMQPWVDAGSQSAWTDQDERLLGIDVRGHGGGQWQLVVRGDQVVGAETGIHSRRMATFETEIKTFAAIVQGRTTVENALADGSARLRGNGRPSQDYAALLEQIVGVATAR